jgi:hypothetical protein
MEEQLVFIIAMIQPGLQTLSHLASFTVGEKSEFLPQIMISQ